MATGMDRLADRITELAGAGTSGRFEPGVIASVTPGAASDGNARVVVTWRGINVPCSYPSSYTPVVGHVVALWIDPPQIFISSRQIGTP